MPVDGLLQSLVIFSVSMPSCTSTLLMCIRTEAFYAAWADADHGSYPNLKLTHRAGLDVIVFDHRTPDAVLEFLRLGVYVCVCALLAN